MKLDVRLEQIKSCVVLKDAIAKNFVANEHHSQGGAGSEVWSRVYMIAPVKEFGRVRLSTNFPCKQIWRRMQTCKDDAFLLGFKLSRVQISRERFYELL